MSRSHFGRSAPHLVAMIDLQPAQEVRKLPVRRMRDRGVEMRTRIYRAQPHLLMQTSNPLVVDFQPAPFQLRRQARDPVKRHIHINIHDFVLGLFIGGDIGDGAVLAIVIARPRHLEQTQLPTDAQIRMLIPYLSFSGFKPQAKDTCRKKSISTSRRPIFFIRSSSV